MNKKHRRAHRRSIERQTEFELPFESFTVYVDNDHAPAGQWGIVIETNLKIYKEENSEEKDHIGDRLMLHSKNLFPFIAMTSLMENAIRIFLKDNAPDPDDPRYSFDEMRKDVLEYMTVRERGTDKSIDEDNTFLDNLFN
tara:strand:- start:887 stop:1306 length:420 start_codon:yes stop_codon:yes gene_type:complete